MKSVMLLFVAGAIALVQVTYAAEDILDKVDIDEVLGNDRLLENYFGCLMGTKPCSPEGRNFRERLPEAIKTGCAKCTEGHKDGLLKIIRFLKKNKPDMWTKLTAKYDPTGEYTKQHAAKF